MRRVIGNFHVDHPKDGSKASFFGGYPEEELPRGYSAKKKKVKLIVIPKFNLNLVSASSRFSDGLRNPNYLCTCSREHQAWGAADLCSPDWEGAILTKRTTTSIRETVKTRAAVKSSQESTSNQNDQRRMSTREIFAGS